MIDDWKVMLEQNENLRQRSRELEAEVARLKRCLGFLASVIKSGEPWTETCEREYRAALGATPPS